MPAAIVSPLAEKTEKLTVALEGALQAEFSTGTPGPEFLFGNPLPTTPLPFRPVAPTRDHSLDSQVVQALKAPPVLKQ